MREVGDGFSEEGTELRTRHKEKLVTWCAERQQWQRPCATSRRET